MRGTSSSRSSLKLAQNIDKIFFAKNGKLSNEFNLLYASLFKSPEQYIDVVTALGRKKVGMTREEIMNAIDKPCATASGMWISL